MEISEASFLDNFSSQFDDIDKSTITLETVFKDVDGWNSMTALSLIAMADESYNVRLSGDDIRNASTVSDIFNIVKAKAK